MKTVNATLNLFKVNKKHNDFICNYFGAFIVKCKDNQHNINPY